MDALTMEAVSTFEMSISFCQIAQPNIPENIHLFIQCHNVGCTKGTMPSLQEIDEMG
jgi:hypothetical protein